MESLHAQQKGGFLSKKLAPIKRVYAEATGFYLALTSLANKRNSNCKINRTTGTFSLKNGHFIYLESNSWIYNLKSWSVSKQEENLEDDYKSLISLKFRLFFFNLHKLTRDGIGFLAIPVLDIIQAHL